VNQFFAMGAIAVLCALDSELDGLKKEVEVVGRALAFEGRPVTQARWGGRRLLLTKTGSNPISARAIAAWLVREQKVAGIVSVGPAGALSDDLRIGDVVIASTGTNQNGRGPSRCGLREGMRVLMVGHFIASGVERVRLRREFGADVVDMSSEVIAGAGVPCILIREITDRADENAPSDFANSVAHKRPRTIPAALCAIGELVKHE
jgi:nucleoside phosphorylase